MALRETRDANVEELGGISAVFLGNLGTMVGAQVSIVDRNDRYLGRTFV